MSRKPQALSVPKDNLAAMRELMELDTPLVEEPIQVDADTANKSSNVQLNIRSIEHLNFPPSLLEDGKTRDVRLSVQVNEDFHTRLKNYCVRHKISMRTFITTVAEAVLSQESEQMNK